MTLYVGSKSPLALVDSFFLTSVKDGMEYTYIYIKEKGKVPSPIFQNEQKTSKENGITITIPLGTTSKINLQNLYNECVKECVTQLYGFKDSFRIVEDASVPYDDMIDVTEKLKLPEPVLEMQNFVLYKVHNNHYSYISDSIQIGPVNYPIPSNFYTSSYYYSDSEFQQLKNLLVLDRDCDYYYNVALKVPIGEFDIPMSRETVNNSAENKALFIQYAKDAVTELKVKINSLGLRYDTTVKDFINQFYDTSKLPDWFKYINIQYNLDKLKTLDPQLFSEIRTATGKDFNHYRKNVSLLDTIKVLSSLTHVNQAYNIYRFTESSLNRVKHREFLSTFSKIYSNSSDSTLAVVLIDKHKAFTSSAMSLIAMFLDDEYDLKDHSIYMLSDLHEYPILVDNILNYLSLNNPNKQVFDLRGQEEDIKEKFKAFRKSLKVNKPSVTYVADSGYFAQTVFSTFTEKTQKVFKLLDSSGKVVPLGSEYLNKDIKDVIVLPYSEVKAKIKFDNYYQFEDFQLKNLSDLISNTVFKLNQVQVLYVPDDKLQAVVDSIVSDTDFNLLTEDNKKLIEANNDVMTELSISIRNHFSLEFSKYVNSYYMFGEKQCKEKIIQLIEDNKHDIYDKYIQYLKLNNQDYITSSYYNTYYGLTQEDVKQLSQYVLKIMTLYFDQHNFIDSVLTYSEYSNNHDRAWKYNNPYISQFFREVGL